MRRINWPFAAICIIAVLGVAVPLLSRYIGVIPREVLVFIALFGVPAIVTASASFLGNVFIMPSYRRQNAKFFIALNMMVAVVGLLTAYWDDTPERNFADSPWATVATTLGGLTVIILQLLSCKHIKEWRRFILFYDKAKDLSAFR